MSGELSKAAVTPSVLEIYNMCTVSTLHLPETALGQLSTHPSCLASGPSVNLMRTFGEYEHEGAIERVLSALYDEGCDYVLFDADGPVLTNLKVFNHS